MPVLRIFANARYALLALALVGGVASGPSALNAGAESVPPIEWSTLPFMFFGSAVAVFVVLALQVALKNDQAFSYGWKFFAISAVYAVAAGLSAVGIAAYRSVTGPSAFAILAFGCGMVLALAALKATFAGRLQ